MSNDTEMGSVLIIDDDPSLLSLYETVFSLQNIPYVIARNGEEGLDQARKIQPNLIIVDLMMPNMNGKEFLKKIKDDSELKDIPVIVSTALAEEIEKQDALALGAKDYFVKTDLGAEEFATLVKHYLKQKPGSA